MIPEWPVPQLALANSEQNDIHDEDLEIDIEGVDEESEDNDIIQIEPSVVLVEFSQLKLLLRKCHYCGHNINEESVRYRMKGGTLFAKFWCSKCYCYR